jgi:hypothetical protein
MRRRTSTSHPALPWPEEQIDLVTVVRATAKLDVVDGRRTTRGPRHDVVVLEEAPLLAPVAVLGDERAATSVSRGDRAANRRRHRLRSGFR